MTSDDRYKPIVKREPTDVNTVQPSELSAGSKIVWLALNSVFGWNRLSKLAEAEARYKASSAQLQRATHNLDTLEETLEREDQLALERHKAELAKLKYQAEADELARQRLIHEHKKELERIRAETRRYKEVGKTERAHPNDAITDPSIREVRNEMKRYIDRETYIEPLTKEAYDQIDRLVAQGDIAPAEVDEKKRKVADYIRSKVMQE